MRALRSAQSLAERDYKDRKIQEKLFSLAEFKRAKTISVYISRKGEVGTRDIIKEALRLEKRVAVPGLQDGKLCMCLIDDSVNLDAETPFFKRVQDINKVPQQELDLVIVPGLAFDKKGRRIGSGKGFYDIFLEKIKGQAGIIGLGYDFQILPEIPNELHDVCMDKIITEKRII